MSLHTFPFVKSSSKLLDSSRDVKSSLCTSSDKSDTGFLVKERGVRGLDRVRCFHWGGGGFRANILRIGMSGILHSKAKPSKKVACSRLSARPQQPSAWNRLWKKQLLIHITCNRKSTLRFTKLPCLGLIRLVLTEIPPFKR